MDCELSAADYKKFLCELSLTESTMLEVAEHQDWDYVKAPVVVKWASWVGGLGVFARSQLLLRDTLLARGGTVWTQIGRFTNHSLKPNAKAILDKGNLYFLLLDDVQQGREILVNYRQVREVMGHG